VAYRIATVYTLGPSLQFTGVCMSPENVAILKTLALRPSPSIATSVRPMIEALEQSGHVANGPDGWSTTAKGCELLERQRLDALFKEPALSASVVTHDARPGSAT
jgi:hypothetical protein